VVRPGRHSKATVNILFEGYLGRPDHRVAPTVGLLRDGNVGVLGRMTRIDEVTRTRWLALSKQSNVLAIVGGQRDSTTSSSTLGGGLPPQLH
jgi:hypothetical protein